MKKTIKDLFKLITAIATVAGILYVARDQIKAIIAKIKEFDKIINEVKLGAAA
jgi:DNA-directed RNA polymerase subunit delta